MSTNTNVEPFFVKDCALVTIATGKKAHKADCRIISSIGHRRGSYWIVGTLDNGPPDGAISIRQAEAKLEPEVVQLDDHRRLRLADLSQEPVPSHQ